MANMRNRRPLNNLRQRTRQPPRRLALAAVVLSLVGMAGCSTQLEADLVIHFELPEDDYQYTILCSSGSPPDVAPAVDAIDPEQACKALSRQDIRDRLISGIVKKDETCALGLEEARAIITGTINGEQVDTTATREDGCARRDWDLLGDLLPLK